MVARSIHNIQCRFTHTHFSMEDQSIKLKDHLSLTIVLMWIDLKERKYRHDCKIEEDLFLLMINDIPRLGTGYLVISRRQQNIIIQ